MPERFPHHEHSTKRCTFQVFFKLYLGEWCKDDPFRFPTRQAARRYGQRLTAGWTRSNFVVIPTTDRVLLPTPLNREVGNARRCTA